MTTCVHPELWNQHKGDSVMSKRLRVVLVACLMTIASIVLIQYGRPIVRSATASESPAVSAQDQLHQKLVERKQLLDQVVKELELSVKFGRGSITSLEYRQAEEAALRAGLDLCQSKEERISIFEEVLKSYATREKQLELEFELGYRPPADMREAKLARLGVEIALLKEQLR
jgi:hypothetical protein